MVMPTRGIIITQTVGACDHEIKKVEAWVGHDLSTSNFVIKHTGRGKRERSDRVINVIFFIHPFDV